MFRVVSDFAPDFTNNYYILPDQTRYVGSYHTAVLFAEPGKTYEDVCNTFLKLMKRCRIENATMLPLYYVVELRVHHVIQNEYEAEAWF